MKYIVKFHSKYFEVHFPEFKGKSIDEQKNFIIKYLDKVQEVLDSGGTLNSIIICGNLVEIITVDDKDTIRLS